MSAVFAQKKAAKNKRKGEVRVSKGGKPLYYLCVNSAGDENQRDG